MEMIEFEGRKVPATYLGDAVYVIYDGCSYLLRLSDHRNTDREICLEPSVMDRLNAFRAECNELREAIERENERKESENLANPNNTQEG